MSNFVIPIEEFNEKAELAAVGQKLAVARSELSILKEQKDSFLKEQIDETQAEINKYVKNSNDALKNLSKYRQELEDFRKVITSYATELEEKRKSQENIIKEADNTHKKTLKILNEKNLELDTINREIKMEIEGIKARKEFQDRRESELNDKERAVNDKYKALEQAVKHLKK